MMILLLYILLYMGNIPMQKYNNLILCVCSSSSNHKSYNNMIENFKEKKKECRISQPN